MDSSSTFQIGEPPLPEYDVETTGEETRSTTSISTMRTSALPEPPALDRLSLRSKRQQSDNLSSSESLTIIPKSSSFISSRNRKSLDEMTIDKLKFSQLTRLYGREEQIQQLKDIFAASQSSRSLVLVQGPAGVGKSVLVNSLSKTVRAKQGFFIYGKFDQQQQEEPYQAIAGACQQLVEEMVGQYPLDDSQSVRSSSKVWKFSQEEFVEKINETFDEEDLKTLEAVIPSLRVLLLSGKNDIVESDNVNSNNDDGSISSNEAESDLGATQRQSSSNYAEAKLMFLHAFRRFIRMVASFGPLVLVLDDVQWADAASLELMEAVVSDDQTPSIMITGLYRSTEVDQDHALTKMVSRLQEGIDSQEASANEAENEEIQKPSKQSSSKLSITNLSVENLTEDSVRDLISDLLMSPQEDCVDLAKLTHAKTNGNAFFCKQFLLSLESDKLLEYSFGAMAWKYDIETIKVECSATDNVADLLKQKLKKLPDFVQSFLPRVACLGARFLVSMFELVVADSKRRSKDQVDADTDERKPDINLLATCQEEGLLLDCGHGWFKWEHDRLQEAALLSVEKRELQSIQFDVGKLLLEKLSTKDLTSALFVVTNLLNCGVEGDEENCNNILADLDAPLRLAIAKLNLRAGRAAYDLAAYDFAVSFLETGIEMLPDNKLDAVEYQAVVLDLYSTAAEAEVCVGNFEAMGKYCDKIFEFENVDLLDKRRAYNVTLYSMGANSHQTDAIALCLEVLEQLNCKFPKRGRNAFMLAGIFRTLGSWKKTTEKIKTLPVTLDPKQQWASRLLERLIIYTYQGDPEFCPLAMLKAHRWTLKYGTSEYSAPVLASIALMFAGSLGEFAGGRAYAENALRLMHRSVEARTLFITNYFVLPWQIPIEKCKKPLLRGYDVGLRTGDVESAFWCILTYLELTFWQNGNLESLLDDMNVYCQQTEKFGQEHILCMVKIVWQVVAHLSEVNSPHEKHTLTGEIMNESDLVAHLDATKDEHTRLHLNRWRICIAFWFCEYEKVVEIMESTGTHKFLYEKALPGICGIGPLYCHCAVACFQVSWKNKKYKKFGLGFYKKIKSWGSKGNPNFHHMEALLDAELNALNGKPHDACQKYEVAILLSGRRGLTGDQAYSHERYAAFRARTYGEGHNDAQYHYNKAHALYSDWGAYAKVERLPEGVAEMNVPFQVSVDGGADDVSFQTGSMVGMREGLISEDEPSTVMTPES